MLTGNSHVRLPAREQWAMAVRGGPIVFITNCFITILLLRRTMMKLNLTSGSATPVITAAAFCLTILLPGTASAVSLGQVDDFENPPLLEPTLNWRMGNNQNVTNEADGGPLGSGDNFLKSVGDGGTGPDGKISVFNRNQWTGNYTAAGVTGISVDLINLSATETLTVRLGVANDTGGKFSTTYGLTLVPGSGWTPFVFSLAPSDLTAVSDGNAWTGGIDVVNTLANVLELRFINSVNPGWTGGTTQTSAILGIDNITAVPLPAAVWLFGSGLLGLIGISRRKKAT